MTIIELQERLRFQVNSTTLACSTRLVDLGEFEGSGMCSCWKFARQIRPQLEQHLGKWKGKPGTYVPEARHQCEHLMAVRFHLANRLVQQVRLAYPDDNQKT